jgi:glycosyltransferase involved in cell wall biosynthesis
MLHEIVTLWPSLRVTLAAMTDLGAAQSAPRLQDSGIEVAYGEAWPSWFERRLCHYGVVFMSRPQPAVVDEWLRSTQPQAFRIYDAEALVYRRLERMLPFVDDAKRTELIVEIRDTRMREFDYLAAADEVLCVSPEERRVARALTGPSTPVLVLPFCADFAESPPGFAERRDLLYFGGFMAGPGSPNEDAVLYLASEVLPLIRQRVPDVVLHVVGADPTPAVLALESEAIHIVGYVEDPRTWLDRVRVHLAPMRFGSGVKLKLVDTIAAGLPFVTTPVGAEGLRLGSLARRTVADTSRDVAELTLAFYLDADRWIATQQEILGLASRHGRPRFRRLLANALSRAGIGPPYSESAPAAAVIGGGQ